MRVISVRDCFLRIHRSLVAILQLPEVYLVEAPEAGRERFMYHVITDSHPTLAFNAIGGANECESVNKHVSFVLRGYIIVFRSGCSDSLSELP